MSRSHCRPAFTLVELLVVIGIIAVLIAILLPVLNKTRATAQTAVCLSNLRQLATAVIMFANDHKGYMPKAYNNGGPRMQGWNTVVGERWEFNEPMWGWEYVLLKYLGKNRNILRCPSDTADAIRYTWNDTTPNLPDKPDADNVAASYRYNWSNEIYEGNPSVYAQTVFVSPKITRIKPANKAILFFDGLGSHADQIREPNTENYITMKTWDGRYNVMSTNPWNVAFRRHSPKVVIGDAANPAEVAVAIRKGLANYAFADGHVETMAFIDTWKSYDPTKPGPSMWQVTGFVKGLPQQP